MKVHKGWLHKQVTGRNDVKSMLQVPQRGFTKTDIASTWDKTQASGTEMDLLVS